MTRSTFASIGATLDVACGLRRPPRASRLRNRNRVWSSGRKHLERLVLPNRDALLPLRRRDIRPLYCQRDDGDLQRPRYQDTADAVVKGLGGINVYLVGMMGSGKTTVGSVLAESLNYLFIDSDQLIEKAAKCSVSEVFEMQGEEEFRKLETSVLQDLHQYKNLVVGTGGGVVLRGENWSYLHQGVVVFLNGSPEKLAHRVAKDGLGGRPLLSQTPEEELSNPVDIAKEKLTRIFSEREKFYKNADIEVSLEDPSSPSGLASVEEVVTRLLSQLQRRLDDARRQREERKNYQVRGTTDLPDGRSTINIPVSEDTPKGFE